MEKIELSKMLGELVVSFDRIGEVGATMTGEQCRELAAMLRLLTARAAALEAAEDELADMEALARDLDVTARPTLHFGRMRAAVVREAVTLRGTNVTLFPIIPRPIPREGGAA